MTICYTQGSYYRTEERKPTTKTERESEDDRERTRRRDGLVARTITHFVSLFGKDRENERHEPEPTVTMCEAGERREEPEADEEKPIIADD